MYRVFFIPKVAALSIICCSVSSYLCIFVLSFFPDKQLLASLSFLFKDEKLQDVLGHFQKDFEGGVSAENLGKSIYCRRWSFSSKKQLR
jgi:hypothetical protein